MFVSLSAAFQNAFLKIHAIRKLFELQNELSRGGRAIDEWRPEGLEANKMVAVHMTEKASQWGRSS